MKKLVSLMLSVAVVLSSMSVFAAPNQYGIEPETVVPVSLDTKIGTSVVNLADYRTEPEALVIETKTGSATIQAKATIDMTDFAEKWDEYVTAGASRAATNFGIDAETARAAVLEYAELTGEFTVKVTVDKEISNATASIVWSDNVTELFSEVSRNLDESDPDKNVMTVVMGIKDDTTNEELDAYFMGILADPKTSDEEMSLTLANTTVAGAYGEEYEIKTQFVGGVTIAVPSAGDMEVNFDETDTNYVELKYKEFGGTGGGTVSTPAPTEAPTEVPTEAPTEEPTVEPTATPEPQVGGTSTGATLNYDNHYAYIIGYEAGEDGSIEVRPENSITRAEVATIFYRLLDDASREKFLTKDNSFPDVDSDDWYNNAVSTVAAAGIVEGYDDGTFGPDRAITRAEFATIASRFSTLTHDGEPLFTDVAGHWAEDYINCAAVTGWVNGYDDGTFRPENKITRAEAITLINRVLYRTVDSEGLLAEGYIDFVDNAPTAWYYIAILEASNSHDYDREKLGALETHKELTENIDWDAHEE